MTEQSRESSGGSGGELGDGGLANSGGSSTGDETEEDGSAAGGSASGGADASSGGADASSGGADAGSGGADAGSGIAEGKNCDALQVKAKIAPPECSPGDLPEVVSALWGECVPLADCGCESPGEQEQCGDGLSYICGKDNRCRDLVHRGAIQLARSSARRSAVQSSATSQEPTAPHLHPLASRGDWTESW